MKSKNFLSKIPLVLLMVFQLILPMFIPAPVAAIDQFTNSTGGECPDGYIQLSVPVEGNKDCALQGEDQNNPIFVYLRAIIKFLAAGVGLVIVLIIVIAGIRYISSGGNPQAVEAAKKLLFAGVMGLIAFIFAFALLNYLVPGGIIK